VLTACFYGVLAEIKLEIYSGQQAQVFSEVVEMILGLGFHKREFSDEDNQWVDSVRIEGAAERFGFSFKENDKLIIFLDSNQNTSEIEIMFQEFNAHFSELALSKYRTLVKSLEEIQGIEQVIADKKTRKGQVLLTD
jgi:hypothetical protein